MPQALRWVCKFSGKRCAVDFAKLNPHPSKTGWPSVQTEARPIRSLHKAIYHAETSGIDR